jgi:hypothetical protein
MRADGCRRIEWRIFTSYSSGARLVVIRSQRGLGRESRLAAVCSISAPFKLYRSASCRRHAFGQRIRCHVQVAIHRVHLHVRLHIVVVGRLVIRSLLLRWWDDDEREIRQSTLSSATSLNAADSQLNRRRIESQPNRPGNEAITIQPTNQPFDTHQVSTRNRTRMTASRTYVDAVCGVDRCGVTTIVRHGRTSPRLSLSRRQRSLHDAAAGCRTHHLHVCLSHAPMFVLVRSSLSCTPLAGPVTLCSGSHRIASRSCNRPHRPSPAAA